MIWKISALVTKWQIKENDLSNLRKDWNKDIPYIKERVNLLFANNFEGSVFKNKSPATLTKVGKDIAKLINANKIIEDNIKKLKELVNDKSPKNAYDLQGICFSIIDDNMEKMIGEEYLNIAKNESIKHGIPLDHTLSLFAILLRDILLKENNWDIYDIDKKNKMINKKLARK